MPPVFLYKLTTSLDPKTSGVFNDPKYLVECFIKKHTQMSEKCIFAFCFIQGVPNLRPHRKKEIKHLNMKRIFIVSLAVILLWNFYGEGITFRLQVIKTSANVFLSESLHTQANGILHFNAWLISDYEKGGNFQERIVKLMKLVPPCLTWWLRGQENFSGMLDMRQNCILMVKKNSGGEKNIKNLM